MSIKMPLTHTHPNKNTIRLTVRDAHIYGTGWMNDATSSVSIYDEKMSKANLFDCGVGYTHLNVYQAHNLI